ncbi:rRNA processing protein [Leucoagaricus gongylophorus]
MPKSAKKRKDKAADFTKAKLKLGKEKKAPANVIDTSFKARSIALPTQSITAPRDENVPTTRRNQTIDNLLAQLKHYSSSVKKEALLGLTELLKTYSILIRQNLTQVMNQLARMIGDEDAGVRKQLLTNFSWILPRISREDLIPHASTLILFTASAQTHIFPEIRIDAVRFLTLFLEYIPEPLLDGWTSMGSSYGKRILEGYLGNLNAGTKYGGSEGPAMATSTSSVILSPPSKLAILKSFSAFLRAGLSIQDSKENSRNPEEPLYAWFMSNSFSTPRAFKEFENLFASSTPSDTQSRRSEKWIHDWTQPEEPPQDHRFLDIDVPWTIREVEDVTTTPGRLSEGSDIESSIPTFLAHLARTLHPFLVSTILDCAPSTFSPDAKTSETETSMMLTVCQIASLLYGTILASAEVVPTSSLLELEALLGYLTPYFPFTASVKSAESFQVLNLIYCELTSFLALRSKSASMKSGRSLKPSNILTMQVSMVSDYIIKLLRGQNTSITRIPSSVTASVYLALLPSIWTVINDSYPELSSHVTDVLQALLEHASQTPSKSRTKHITIEFVARLFLLEAEVDYRGTFRAGSHHQARQLFEDWLIGLPQVLWETGTAEPMTTEVILRFLLRWLQRRTSLVHPQVISPLALRLIPYFIFNHPVRGQLVGPYRNISPPLQQLCLNMVATLLACGRHCGAGPSEGCDNLFRAVNSAVADTAEKEHWIQMYMYMGISPLP